MAKLLVMNVKDLDNFIKYLKEKGYNIIEGQHAVLTDNSEIEEFHIIKNNELKGLMLAHYITPYYKTIIENKDKSDEEILKALIKTKHSTEKWRTPVNPIALIIEDPTIENAIKDYKDDYPSLDARKYSEYYKANTPDRTTIFSNALSHILSTLAKHKHNENQ
ncbi:hypothetical protein J4526_01125 [Desulfurococcaceae archaeon MEX13E-LK6-19]|nr:hypothetical protein J4526_01125 [Desulfurococcaceae archaeon MEX13E-LK6-19]